MNRIDEIISPFLKGLGVEEAVRLEGIKKEWSNFFGEPLSLHMHPLSLKNGELMINVDSPVWLQQISFFKTEIINKLTAFDVIEVRFRLGKAKPSRKTFVHQDSQTYNAQPDKKALQYIDDTVSEIKDAELRDCVRKSMEKAFSGRQGHRKTEMGRHE